MKTMIQKSMLAMLAIALVIGFTSCSKDEDDETPASKNLVQTAQSDNQFSTLVAALQKAGLVSTLEGAGPFTVFAPTNAAFTTLFNELGVSGLDDLSAETLKPILLNHVVSGSVKSTDISTGYVATANSFGPSSTNVKVFIQKGSSVTVDNSKVTTADILASNGVIHVIDKVILPAGIVNHAINNPDFSILVQAVVKADLVDALSASGPFTVFAPNNAAFNKLFATLGVSGINDLSAEALTPILLYHVVPGNVTASQVSTGNVNTLKEGSMISITANSMGVKINNTSNVIATDVQGTNGVIHAIDTVILP
jgi:transforming growth factor-beta-induced protein